MTVLIVKEFDGLNELTRQSRLMQDIPDELMIHAGKGRRKIKQNDRSGFVTDAYFLCREIYVQNVS